MDRTNTASPKNLRVFGRSPLFDPYDYAELAPLAQLDPHIAALEEASPSLKSIRLDAFQRAILYDILVLNPDRDYTDITHIYDNQGTGQLAAGDWVIIGDETGERMVTLSTQQVKRFFDITT